MPQALILVLILVNLLKVSPAPGAAPAPGIPPPIPPMSGIPPGIPPWYNLVMMGLQTTSTHFSQHHLTSPLDCFIGVLGYGVLLLGRCLFFNSGIFSGLHTSS